MPAQAPLADPAPTARPAALLATCDGGPGEAALAEARCIVADGVPVRRENRPGRNHPCHCGSGRKYKKCHLEVDEPAGVTHEPSRGSS